MEDEKILELYWERSETALTETKNKYGVLLISIAERILRDRRDAEECENDTYVTAWETIPPVRPNNFKVYLAKVTHKHAIDKLRAYLAKKRGEDVVTCSYEELVECIPDGEEDRQRDGDELRECLESFLRSLAKEKRVLFMKRYYMSCSISELAKQTGYNEKKIMNRLYQLRLKLKKYLERGNGRINRWDLVYAVENVNDDFLCEILDEKGSECSRHGFRRIAVVTAAVLFVLLIGSRLLFVHGSLRYRMVEFRSPFQPVCDVGHFPVWSMMVNWERYPKVKYKGEWYSVVLKESPYVDWETAVICEPEKIEGRSETGRAVGEEIKRCSIRIGYVGIMREMKVPVYKISGEDMDEMIAVRFEGEEGFYYYRRTK